MSDRAIALIIQELRELGLGGTWFRARWELLLRSGLVRYRERPAPAYAGALVRDGSALRESLARTVPFWSPAEVAQAMRPLVPAEHLDALGRTAREAVRGRIVCFGRWVGDYGDPIDWQVNPQNGRRWPRERHWSRALSDELMVGDIKLTWELGRFPHAYAMARAAAFDPSLAPSLAAALAAQIESFVARNPYGCGVHWGSGQELAFRMMAWWFAFSAFASEGAVQNAGPLVARATHSMAVHVERHLDYARKAVFNNHLLSEAFALLLAGTLLADAPEAPRWREVGLATLAEQAEAQVFPDGGYIQNSHNYQRVALQVLLWASVWARQNDLRAPASWGAAMERSLAFLVAQQNPSDGRLPNFGANDGALPSVLSTCDFSDFRPTLQAVSVCTRGERLYPPGPWDEEAVWLLGSTALELPLRPPVRRSVSFAFSGQQVLRGRDAASYSAMRCGTVRSRFSQIDMLHLDVWWRGYNVLVDGGSCQYNGSASLHAHFMRTASHNTVELDGLDQMLHHRRFKNLYPTEAKLLGFVDQEGWALCEGEHFGYRRHPGRCVHRRAVLLVKDELWIVVDRLAGDGAHTARLHWLGGDFPYRYSSATARLALTTPLGDFTVTTLDAAGAPLAGDVVTGGLEPLRGWLSRYYAEKIPVPSLVVERRAEFPLTLVSVLGAGAPMVSVSDGRWRVSGASAEVSYTIEDGRFVDIAIQAAPGGVASA